MSFTDTAIAPTAPVQPKLTACAGSSSTHRPPFCGFQLPTAPISSQAGYTAFSFHSEFVSFTLFREVHGGSGGCGASEVLALVSKSKLQCASFYSCCSHLYVLGLLQTLRAVGALL